MAPDDSPFDDVTGRRDYARVLVAAVCLLAIVVAAASLPVLSPEGTESPLASAVPIPGGGGPGGGTSSGGSGGGLGALSPGQSTDVGGDLGGESALRSQSAETHFVVRSTEPAYWRTGSYATYTGGGWERAGDTRPYDGPIETRGPAGREVTYQVRLNRTARALPTVWRPSTVSRDGALVTEGKALRADGALTPGATYTGVSHRPPADEQLLRTAGTDYPADVERRYTQVPEETERRLGPVTEEIAGDASTPYETAERVEAWLESEKEYSLNVSEPAGEDVASQFVLEMDAGYCEYFATSMAAMLRTQDIPARYVVGYSTGQQTGENSYTVRGMNAHAWVEVYFPGAGWVKFDPTPAQERRQQERESFEEQRDGEYEPPTTQVPADGSGNETRPGESDPDGTETAPDQGDGDESGGDGQDDQQAAGETAISLNRSAAPGAPVTVTVSRDGTPVEGATVLFNGESVGTTGGAGNVTGTVPYDDQLNVTVLHDDQIGALAPGVPSGIDDRLYAAQAPRDNASATFDLEGNATVTVTGDVVTDSDVTVSAAVDGVPVRDAAVSLDGESVARTDGDGRAQVTLPADPGRVTVRVERGSVSGNRTLDLDALNVTTRPTAPLALPLTGLTVNATLGGEPVPGANVSVAGEPAGETGLDGTATVDLPPAGSVAVVVSARGQRQTTTVGGLFVNLALVLGTLGAVVGGIVLGARRSGVTPGGLGHWLWLAGQWAVAGVVAVGDAADRALARLAARARLTAAHLRALVTGRRSPAELLAALRRWVDVRVTALRGPVETAAATVAAGTGDGDGDDDSAADAHATVRQAWRRFLARLSLGRPRTHTPGEIASHAVDVDGLPVGPVHTVVDAFRAVEYGQRDPADRAPDATAALDAIDDALGAGDGESDDAAVGDGDAWDVDTRGDEAGGSD